MHKLIENQVRISVRNLVEFILRSGDIDNRYSTKAQYDADADRKSSAQQNTRFEARVHIRQRFL